MLTSRSDDRVVRAADAKWYVRNTALTTIDLDVAFPEYRLLQFTP